MFLVIFIPKWRRPGRFLPRCSFPIHRWVILLKVLRKKLKLNKTWWKLFNVSILEKSRVSWLKEGDRCSKFFHNCAKIKRAKSFIHALSIDDVLVEDKQAIAEWWTITKGYTLLPILVFLLLTCLLLFLLWSQRVIMVILLQSLLMRR